MVATVDGDKLLASSISHECNMKQELLNVILISTDKININILNTKYLFQGKYNCIQSIVSCITKRFTETLGSKVCLMG